MSVLDGANEPGHGRTAGAHRLVAVLGRPSRAGGRRCASSASINDAGEVVYVADTAGPASASALVQVATCGNAKVLVRAGESAPGGGRYASFGEVDLGPGDRLLFQARLAGCEATEGLFLRAGGEVLAVARAGEQAPGGGHYASFRQLTLASYPPPLAGEEGEAAADARLAYAARTTDGRISLVIWPAGRGPRRVMTTGGRVAGGVLEDFAISRLGLAVCVVARIRYGVSKRRVALLASEDQLSGEERLRDGGELPELGVIGRLVSPPAISLLDGHLGLALDDGGQALATRPAGGQVRVLARSGDPAPGLPGRQLTKLGPPVANGGVPGGECGVAAAVQLCGGQAALWSGTLHAPPAIRLVAGERIGDERAVRVDAFTPVKLTNTGELLLHSTVDIDGRAADGLMLVNRLFG